MKHLNLIQAAGIVALTGLGVTMAIANPSESDYEEYATQQLTTYVKDNVCPQAPKNFNRVLRRYCKSLVDVGRPQLARAIAENTDRYNFIVFSVYRTELSINPLLPTYHFQTIAAFEQFYTFESDKL
jgi:Domain of unknown function (DUF4359)